MAWRTLREALVSALAGAWYDDGAEEALTLTTDEYREKAAEPDSPAAVGIQGGNKCRANPAVHQEAEPTPLARRVPVTDMPECLPMTFPTRPAPGAVIGKHLRMAKHRLLPAS